MWYNMLSGINGPGFQFGVRQISGSGISVPSMSVGGYMLNQVEACTRVYDSNI